MTSEPYRRPSADESALEPVERIRRSGTVLRTGRLALSAGTGSDRVEEHMSRVGRALGLDRVAAHVTLTEITATSHQGPIFRTELTEARSVGINADRLSELERFTSSLRPGAGLASVEAGLDRIAGKPLLYGTVLNEFSTGTTVQALGYAVEAVSPSSRWRSGSRWRACRPTASGRSSGRPVRAPSPARFGRAASRRYPGRRGCSTPASGPAREETSHSQV